MRKSLEALRAMNVVTVEQTSYFRLEALNHMSEQASTIKRLEAQIDSNTGQIALMINPPCIEQPSHEDLILWLESYVGEFKAKSEMVELLQAQIDEQSGWVSCEDRLPEDGQVVLVWYKTEQIPYSNVGQTRYRGGKMNKYVTHWQTLPSPPNKEGE